VAELLVALRLLKLRQQVERGQAFRHNRMEPTQSGPRFNDPHGSSVDTLCRNPVGPKKAPDIPVLEGAGSANAGSLT
jgi:hypothetical protein